ncbi:MAG: hypothetical protein AMXMBFR84_39940 [Candidatus Hydrogenedentota bacterium]
MHLHTRFCVLIAGLAAIASVSWADDIAQAGRAVLDKNKPAVVTLKIVIKQQFSMPGSGSMDEESTAEVTGTVVDPSGLTVTALSQTDPTAMYESMMSGMGDMMGGGQMQFKSVISDLKILLEDGTEIPGKVVLRDKDLDLLFVRPEEKPATPMAFVDLSGAGKPEMLDQIVILNRLGQVAFRAYSAGVARVEAVVTRPRTLYIPGGEQTLSGLGSPVFTVDGGPVGLLVLRSSSGGSGSPMSFMSNFSDNMIAVIVPSDDIAEVAAQAPEKAEEVPAEEAPAEESADAAPAEGDAPAAEGAEKP